MATYLQGVTDYIPQIQPFQPNINLMANVLQTKQSKYDSNHKAISNVYSQMVYADLSREDNQERRDELVKAIDFNLKKVAGMDLSLSQNVRQAQQLFTPFYEDKYLMKDMAFTKNYMSQRGRADGLKNSTDEKQRAQYWDTGVRAMDYKVQEFKEAELGDTLGFGNVSYTGYVNTAEKALEIAKKADLSIESVEFSQDGRWIIKNKNGQQLMEPLSKLFEATVAKDPAIQAVYQTQAYVNRKDYASVNASMFGGDAKQAEIKYLQEQLEVQSSKMKQRYEQLREKSNVYSNQITSLEKDISSKKSKPGAEKLLAELKSNKQINDSVLTKWQESLEQVEGSESSTANTNNGFRNPYGDIETLRRKVDGAVANDLLYKDLNEAAQTFAYRNFKQDIEANPYKVMEIKHQQAISLENTRYKNRQKLLEQKKINDLKNKQYEVLMEQGAGYVNEKGDFVYYDGVENSFTQTETSGTATDQYSFEEMNRTAEAKNYEASRELTQQMLNTLSDLKNHDKISADDIKGILGMSLEEFNKKSGDSDYINNQLGSKGMNEIWSKYDSFVKTKGKHYTDVIDFNKHNHLTTSLQTFNTLVDSHQEYLQKAKDAATSWLTETNVLKGYSDKQKNDIIQAYLESFGSGMTAEYKDDRYFFQMPFSAQGSDNPIQQKFEQKLMEKGLVVAQPDAFIKSIANKYKEQYGKEPGNALKATSFWEGFVGNPGVAQGIKSLAGPKSIIANSDPKFQEMMMNELRNMKNPVTGKNYTSIDDYLQAAQKANKLPNAGMFSPAARFDSVAHSIFNTLHENVEAKRQEFLQNNKHPLMPAYGDVTNDSYFQTNITGLKVLPGVPSSRGNIAFKQTVSDLKSLDLGSPDINLSIDGITQTGVERFKELNASTNNALSEITKAFIQDMSLRKPKDLNNFEMYFSDVATNELGKESMTLKFNKKDVEDWVKTYDKLEAYGLDEAAIADLTTKLTSNGVSIIAPDKTFNNELASSSRVSNFELAVNANTQKNKPFVVQDTYNSDNTIIFEKDPLSATNYKIKLNLSVYDLATKEYVTQSLPLDSGINTSGQLHNYYNKAMNIFQVTNEIDKKGKEGNLDEYQRLLQYLYHLMQ